MDSEATKSDSLSMSESVDLIQGREASRKQNRTGEEL